MEYIDVFNGIRGLCGDISNPINLDHISQWERHTYRQFAKWERDCILAMDTTLRQSYGEMLKFHAGRSKVNIKDNDKGRLNGRGNPRI